jgi:hypothetical protein
MVKTFVSDILNCPEFQHNLKKELTIGHEGESRSANLLTAMLEWLDQAFESKSCLLQDASLN